MRITTEKLSDLSPTWAPFRGWTVLFEPGAGAHHTATRPGLELLDLSESAASRSLFETFADVAMSVARLPSAGGRLALLPGSTYHVTICDGLSDAHVDAVPASTRPAVIELLDSLPNAVVDPTAMMLGPDQSLRRLLDAATQLIRFGFTGLEVRGHALVAALDVTATDRDAYSEVLDARSSVLRTLTERTGVDLVTEWRPHVTLGYLANRSNIAALRDELDSRSSTVVSRLAEDAFVGHRASLYAFDDMATYWRAATPPADVG